MEVVFTQVFVSSFVSNDSNTDFVRAMLNSLPGVVVVAREFATQEDDRRLVVVLCCPCCGGLDFDVRETDVLVSPFNWIDPDGYDIKRIGVTPPFHTPGENGETSNEEEFNNEWRLFIEEALK